MGIPFELKGLESKSEDLSLESLSWTQDLVIGVLMSIPLDEESYSI